MGTISSDNYNLQIFIMQNAETHNINAFYERLKIFNGKGMGLICSIA